MLLFKSENTKEIELLNQKHELRIEELKQQNRLALEEKAFEIRHFKDDEMKKLQKELNEKSEQIAVMKKENEMLQKITNLNSDIIDVKELVKSLIQKLPEINLKNLTISK